MGLLGLSVPITGLRGKTFGLIEQVITETNASLEDIERTYYTEEQQSWKNCGLMSKIQNLGLELPALCHIPFSLPRLFYISKTKETT